MTLTRVRTPWLSEAAPEHSYTEERADVGTTIIEAADAGCLRAFPLVAIPLLHTQRGETFLVGYHLLQAEKA